MIPVDHTLPIAERFVSINGEGLRAGQLSAFIRFAGCDLACSYCDTLWAHDAAAATEHMTVSELVEWAFSQPTSCITLTGGEPLEQPLLFDLVKGLLDHEGESPRIIEIETNGAHDASALIALREEGAANGMRRNRLSITSDCKLPSSGMAEMMVPSRFAMLGGDDAVKFVCGDYEDLRAAKRIIDAQNLALRTNVLISPVFDKMDPAVIVEFMKENRMSDERLQLQLHKIIWPEREKGV